ncbi:IclR family transcriptional regulator [Novosphingobium kunmingense]|uniref:IclR family transcriptional regulator n=1 Tax=Novosphingobium kunmingense TaxID=1211806 RepID=A0A2N0H6N4_9SPHN|nr:helix-turn-helix domain-containing protein [Novosphingobium kunmingense]PKB14589.1 IclR family transcriptional regulator [Novosphingobium kunmingense]
MIFTFVPLANHSALEVCSSGEYAHGNRRFSAKRWHNRLAMAEQDAPIRSISRALAILRVINREGSVSLMDIAKAVELPYPTTLRIVRTLVEEGVIEREPARKWYRPTALIQSLAYGFQNNDLLVTVARPHLASLTEQVHWPVSLVTPVGNVMVVRDSTSTMTSFTFNHYYPGWQVPLIASASGRAFLAHASAETRRHLIAYNESHGSEGEVAMLHAFEHRGEMERILALGYATGARNAYSASPRRTSSVAVPLFQDGELLGSLTMVFFSAAMPLNQAVERFVPGLQATATAIGVDMAAAEANE